MALTPEELAELESLENDQDVQSFLNPKPIQEGVSTSSPEAFVRGAAQGLTFGTSDEIAAGLESALSDKTYEKALEESRAEYKLAEEEYPISSILGGIGGGIGQTVALSAAAGATGGAAAPGAAASGANVLSKIAALGKSALMPAKGATTLGTIGKMAASGAVQGGLTSVGRSEKEGLERLEEVPGAAASGAVIGGALGGIGAGLGAAGKAISKKIDAGEAPYSFKMIRDAYRAGEQKGTGFITSKNKAKVDSDLLNSARTSIDDIGIVNKEMMDLDEQILKHVEMPVNIIDDVEKLGGTLNDLYDTGYKDAKLIARQFNKYFLPKAINESGDIKARDANALIQEMKILRKDNEKASGSVLAGVDEFIKNLEITLRSKLDYDSIEQALIKRDASIAPRITSLAAPLTSDEIPMMPLLNKYIPKPDPSKTTGVAPFNALKKGSPEYNAFMAEQIKNSPLGILKDRQQGMIVGSKVLGGILKNSSEEDNLANVFKVFRNIQSQTKDTQSGKISSEKYRVALENLKRAHPDLATKIEKGIQEPLSAYELKKFIEGASLGEAGARESGIIKNLMAIPGSYSAGLSNVAGQVLGAAKKGVAGPIPGATTMIRPNVTAMSSIKNIADSKLTKNPNSPVWKFISGNLEKALNDKDEARRAATLNTLMQYKVFRDMLNEEEKK